MAVPHLTTALTGPLLDLEKRLLDAMPGIEAWFRAQWSDHTPPFYGSVDLRNAGYKLAPVDMNLFPAGFNNLNPVFRPLAIQAAQVTIDHLCPGAANLLIIPESHTRNLYYLQNVATLRDTLRLSGLKVRVGSLLPDITAPTTIDLPDGNGLTLEPLVRRGRRLGLADFDPCVILLNNDLSAGLPEVLRGIDQAIMPPAEAGWHTRRKSQHFHLYDQVAAEFADLIGIDPWVINPFWGVCKGVDFQARTGEECLAETVREVLERTRVKYREMGISQTPFVMVKADAGTYGMGVMSVKDPSEVVGLNRKQRNKMAVVKEGLEVTDVLVQEGVPTFETVNAAVAEPVVYMLDRFVIGGFYRVHTGRGDDENLNAPGMHFVPLAFENGCTEPDAAARPDAPPNRFYAYGVISRLALLAASHEIEALTTPAGLLDALAAKPAEQPEPV